MQILLLGATGRTGTLVLHEALQRGHNVTALVRDPSALGTGHASSKETHLNFMLGSPLNASDVTKAVTAASNGKDQLALISTLNPRRASESPWAAPHPTDSPPRMMADSIANVLAALSETREEGAETPKVVHLSALGVGSSAAQTPWMVRALIAHSNMKLTYADHEAVEAELKKNAKGVTWVSVRANRLVEGEEGAVAKIWNGKGSVGMMATSSRRAVAKFLVDAAECREWDGKAPVIIG